MKKISKYVSPLILAVFVAVFSVLPVFAAENVVFTASQSFILSATSDTIQILHSGTDISVDRVNLNTDSLVITVDDNDTVTLVNYDRKILNATGVSGAVSLCGAGDFRLTIPDQNATVTATTTIGTVCSTGGGGGGGGGGAAAAPAAPAVTPSTTTGNVTANSSLGGNTTVTTSDGNTAKVVVPAAAVSVDTTFTVAPTAKTASTVATQVGKVPSGQQIVGANVYNYAASAAGAAVTAFSSNLTLTFTYLDAQVAGLALSSLKVHKYNEATGAWVALTTTVNTATKTITATTNSFSYFAIFGSAQAGETPVTTTPTTPTPTTPTPTVNLVDVKGSAIVDGDLIKTAASFDIYIVKLIGAKKFKRLILNPAIFNSYGHLKWSNVKTVSQAVQDAYTLAELVIEVNPNGSVFDPKVYKVSSALNSDVGQRQWLNMTAAQFTAKGYDWDSIYHINHTEAGKNFYPLGTPITP